MAKKAFDILPPYSDKKPHHHPGLKKKKEKRKARRLFVLIVAALFFILLFAALAQEEKQTAKESSTQEKASEAPSFELFTSEGQSNLTGQEVVKVRVLNGSTDQSRQEKVKTLLLKAGFEIEKTEVSSNPYENTIIYYNQGEEPQAQKAEEALKNDFPITKTLSDNLSTSYDLLIIIGQK